MSNADTRKEKDLDPWIKSWVVASTGITWESICAKTKFRKNSFPPPHPNLSIHYKICSDIEIHKHGNYPLFTIISRLTALHLPSLKLSLDMKPVYSIYYSTDSEKFNIIEESRRIWWVTWQRIYKVERGQEDKTGIALMEEMGTDLTLCLHNFRAPPRTLGWAVQLEHHQNQFAKY